jgi:hypothetical protein
MLALVFSLGLIAVGILAANGRVPFGWVIVFLVALMALRITQPVTY